VHVHLINIVLYPTQYRLPYSTKKSTPAATFKKKKKNVTSNEIVQLLSL